MRDASAASLAIDQFKLHRVWPARNRPVCGGVLLLGPDGGILALTLTLICGISTLFFLDMRDRVHPTLAILVAVLDVVSIVSLFAVSFTEPGILLRRQPRLAQSGEPPSVQLDGRTMVLKWCKTCNIYRPPRSKHCAELDCCVLEFDHYCPWVSNTIGKRNYRYFVTFLLSVTILDATVLSRSAYTLIQAAKSEEFASSFALEPVATALVCVTFLFFWCLASLSVFHIYLIAIDATTNEHVKGIRIHRTALPPFYVRCVALCTRPPPSRVDFNCAVDSFGRLRGGDDLERGHELFLDGFQLVSAFHEEDKPNGRPSHLT